MQPIKDFLFQHWDAILMYLTVGTILTKAFDKIAKSLPQYPRLTHAAAIVDELVIDIWDAATAIAKFIGGKPPAPLDAAKNAAKVALVCLISLWIVGCGFFSTPAGKAVECDGAELLAAISDLCPPPVTALCTDFSLELATQACQAAANAGASQADATKAGVAAARAGVAHLKEKGIRFEGSAP